MSLKMVHLLGSPFLIKSQYSFIEPNTRLGFTGSNTILILKRIILSSD